MVTCRIVCRARIVPFDHQLEYNLLSTSSINHAFDLAPAAGPCLVNIGHRVASTEPEELTAVQSHISDVLPELDSRGTMEYTLLLTSAIAVCCSCMALKFTLYILYIHIYFNVNIWIYNGFPNSYTM